MNLLIRQLIISRSRDNGTFQPVNSFSIYRCTKCTWRINIYIQIKEFICRYRLRAIFLRYLPQSLFVNIADVNLSILIPQQTNQDLSHMTYTLHGNRFSCQAVVPEKLLYRSLNSHKYAAGSYR